MQNRGPDVKFVGYGSILRAWLWTLLDKQVEWNGYSGVMESALSILSAWTASRVAHEARGISHLNQEDEWTETRAQRIPRLLGIRRKLVALNVAIKKEGSL